MRRERERRYSVYIRGSMSGALYIGITSNLVFRIRQHKDHTFRGFTAKYDVDRLLYYEAYGEASTAIAREKQLKGWKREKDCADRRGQPAVEGLEPRVVRDASKNPGSRIDLSGDRGPSTRRSAPRSE